MITLPYEGYQADVASIFLAYFERAPEYEATQWYVDLYYDLLDAIGEEPAAREQVFDAVAAQIYADGVTHDEVPASDSVSNAWYVNHLYHNVLGREADEGGFDYWVAELDTGSSTRAELVGRFLEAAQSHERDAAYVSNRIEVAFEFAQWENSRPEILNDLEYNAAEVMEGVNEDPASVVAAQARLYSNLGESFSLTTDVDTIEGTPYDDTIDAFYIGEEKASTFTEFDAIDGGAGVDTLNVYVTGGVGDEAGNQRFPETAWVRNVEVVNIFADETAEVAGKGLTNAANYEGIELLWQHDHAASVTNLGENSTAIFQNLALTAAADVGVGAAADATEANIMLVNVAGEDGVAAFRVSGDALQTVNIVGKLAHDDDVLALHLDAGTDVDSMSLLTGVHTNVTLAPGDTPISSFDAADSSGNIAINASDLGTVVLGEGNDTLIFDAAPSLGQTINGGAGFDTAVIGQASFQNHDYQAINQMTNVEALRFVYNREDAIALDAAQVANYQALVFDLLEGEAYSWVYATISNLAADQELHGDNANVLEFTLDNAAADVSVALEDEAWAMLSIAEDGLGETGGTLTFSGDGTASFTNMHIDDEAVGKFAVIDAGNLDGWLSLWDMVPDFEETVILGARKNSVYLDLGSDTEATSSSIGATDLIVNFHSDISSDQHDIFYFSSEVQREIAQADVSHANTLHEAYATAAATEYDDTLVFFHWAGDTYLYANTGAQPGYDSSDFALQVAGVHNFAQDGLIEWMDYSAEA